MTNKELIEHLSTLDPDTRIIVRGYEGGCTELETHKIKPMVVLLGYHGKSSYYGEHECYYPEDYIDPDDLKEYERVDAIMLDRY
jgi:hypothetical protein